MEKPGKSKNLFLKFLPKSASSVVMNFQNPPFSPGREKRSQGNRGFSGPLGNRGFSGSIIPAEARRGKSKNGSLDEPTSPKISCMGQIKHKKKLQEAKKKENKKKSKEKKQTVSFSEIFHERKKLEKEKAAEEKRSNKTVSLAQMRKYASGRDTFANFDWTAQITPVDSDHQQRNYHSDNEKRQSDGEEEESDDDNYDVIIPFSAPMKVGGGGELEPRKEINIWKRRTMAPPRPLQLKAPIKSNSNS